MQDFMVSKKNIYFKQFLFDNFQVNNKKKSLQILISQLIAHFDNFGY